MSGQIRKKALRLLAKEERCSLAVASHILTCKGEKFREHLYRKAQQQDAKEGG